MADEEYEVEVTDRGAGGSSSIFDDAAAQQTPEQKAQQQVAEEEHGDGAPGVAGEEPTSKRRSRLRDRVDELTRKYRTEERAREQRERELEQVKQQFTQTQTQFHDNQRASAQYIQNTLTKHEKLLQANLKYARDRGDTAAEDNLSNELVDVRTQLSQLNQAYPQQQQQQQAPQQQQQAPQQQQQQAPQQQQQAPQQQAQISEAGREWIDANAFLREHKDVHAIVANHEAILRAQHEDPDSPEFYKKLNARIAQDVPKQVAEKLRVNLNDDLEDDDGDADDGAGSAQPAARQASSGMGDGGRSAPAVPRGKQKVKLTRDEVAYCDRMGIDRTAYAREKAIADQQSTATGYTPIV